LVTRIMLIDKGKVVLNGPRDEVLKQITRQTSGAGPGPGSGGGGGGTGTVTGTGIAPKAA
jgi:hypothetical protein